MGSSFGVISDIPQKRGTASCVAHCTLFDALKSLWDASVGSVVVVGVSDNKVRGIFTERDYLVKIAGKDIDIHAEEISAFMTSNPYCLKETDTVRMAMEKMHDKNCRHIVITDENDELKHVISARDIIDHILKVA